jgi:hypothetical protein
MGLTVRADLNLSTYSPINEPGQHAHTLPFYLDRPHGSGNCGGADGGNQSSLSNMLQQLTGLLQQLTSALGQLQQGSGQNNPSTSSDSSGDSGGPLGQLQGIIQQLTQLLQQLSQQTGQGDPSQGDPSNGGSSSGSSAGGPQGQLNSLLQQVNQLLQQLNGQGDASDQYGQPGQYGQGQGSYQPTSYGSAPNCGPSNNQGSLTIGPNNTVDTGRFTINVSNATGGQLSVTDNTTGKNFTVWGDPHGTTSNGGSFDFQQNPVMYKLPDGTSIEVDPTKNSGVNYINSVEIKKGGAGVEFDGVHSGNITEQAISGAPSNSSQPVIGITVDNNDNQTINGGPAINGNMGDIDQYAHQQSNGGGSSGIGQRLVQEGRELEQNGHDLQRQGKFREGAHLIREGRHLELQGRRLERMADQYGAGNNPQVAQQLQQIQQLISTISTLMQQISQASNQAFASNFNNQANAA